MMWMAESGQLTDYWNSIRSGTPNNFIAPSPERGTGSLKIVFIVDWGRRVDLLCPKLTHHRKSRDLRGGTFTVTETDT